MDTKGKGKQLGPYQCIQCTAPVHSLYLTYQNVENTTLSECSSCNAFCDEYQTLPYPVLVLDLLLFKSPVYRHLLFNRGGETEESRRKERRSSAWRIGAVVLGLDAYVRCVNVGPPESLEPFSLMARTLGYCFLESLSLHLCIAVSVYMIQRILYRSQTAVSKLQLLPLTLFYTSLPTLSLLCVSSLIWRSEYLPNSTTSLSSLLSHLPPPTPLDDTDLSPTVKWALGGIMSLSRDNLRSGVSGVRGWEGEALLRKGIGTVSAVVGISGKSLLVPDVLVRGDGRLMDGFGDSAVGSGEEEGRGHVDGCLGVASHAAQVDRSLVVVGGRSRSINE